MYESKYLEVFCWHPRQSGEKGRGGKKGGVNIKCRRGRSGEKEKKEETKKIVVESKPMITRVV